MKCLCFQLPGLCDLIQCKMKDPFCMIVIGIFFVTTNGKLFLKSQTIKVLNNYFTLTEFCNTSFLCVWFYLISSLVHSLFINTCILCHSMIVLFRILSDNVDTKTLLSFVWNKIGCTYFFNFRFQLLYRCLTVIHGCNWYSSAVVHRPLTILYFKLLLEKYMANCYN